MEIIRDSMQNKNKRKNVRHEYGNTTAFNRLLPMPTAVLINKNVYSNHVLYIYSSQLLKSNGQKIKSYVQPVKKGQQKPTNKGNGKYRIAERKYSNR